MGVEQLHVLARGYANRRAREWFEPSAKDLVEQAAKLPLGDFCVVARRWESLADADGDARTHERANLNRDARVGIVGAQVSIEAHAGSGVGVEMVEIFQRFRDVEFLADWEAGRARHGEEMNPSLLTRTPGQRNFDALAAIFRAAAGSGRINVDAPVVNILVDLDSYEHHLAKAVGLPTTQIDPRTFLERRLESIEGHQLAGAEVVAASLAGHVRRVVFESASALVDVGRKRRIFAGPMREVLSLLDRICMWPGCGLPARDCEGDHTRPWSNGGITSADNGGLACGHHNRFKHRHSFRTWRDGDGVWRIARPDGTEINAPPLPIAGS